MQTNKLTLIIFSLVAISAPNQDSSDFSDFPRPGSSYRCESPVPTLEAGERPCPPAPSRSSKSTGYHYKASSNTWESYEKQPLTLRKQEPFVEITPLKDALKGSALPASVYSTIEAWSKESILKTIWLLLNWSDLLELQPKLLQFKSKL